jgi:phenylacetate-coenzyme A ligase PaaK-like adenylate-forming protein
MAQYWNPDMEKLDRKSMGDLQARKLRAMVRDRMFRYHPFYSRSLRQPGIDPQDIEGVDDLKRLPFTTHDDLAADPGSFILAPVERANAGPLMLASRLQYLFYDAVVGNSRIRQIDEYYPVTTFDTAEGVPIYLSKFDMGIFKELCGRAAICAGLSQPDRYQNAYPYGPNVDFWHSHYMALMLRIFAMKTGQAGPREELETAKRLNPTVIACDPYYLCFIAKAAENEFSRLRIALLSGSTLDEPLRSRLKGLLERSGASPALVDSYSVPESKQSMPCCPGGSGYHTYPDVHIWECIDVKTGEPVGEGERGELVFTSIDGRGTTLLRYRTGDIAEGGIVYGECESCGRTVPRIMGPVVRRNGDLAGEVMRAVLDIDGIFFAAAGRARDSRLTIRIQGEDEALERAKSMAERLCKGKGTIPVFSEGP